MLGVDMAQSWEERHDLAFNIFVPWIEQVYPLKGAKVLEFGSGAGAAALAWAKAGASVIGVDIDSPDTEVAVRKSRELGLPAKFVNGSFEHIKSVVASEAGAIDVFMLYAVLEHMTPDERISTLDLARDTLSPNGIIVVVESPNRHHWLDAHTSTLPFFDQLPDEFAFRFADQVPRSIIKDNLKSFAPDTPEAKVVRSRLGRGIGFQEFEHVFGDLGPITMHCNWEPGILANSQGVTREQIALSRFMDRNCPAVPPSFSRYYIDLIIRPSGGEPYPYVRPLPLTTEGSVNAVYTSHDLIQVGAGGQLQIVAPTEAKSIILGVTVFPTMTETGVRFDVLSEGTRVERETQKYDTNTASWVRYEEIELCSPAKVSTVHAKDFLEVSFIGYRPS